MHGFNCLQLLHCSFDSPATVLAFFPTGDNGDEIGYLMLRLEESELRVELNSVNGNVFIANEKLNCRILKLLVNPVDDFDASFSGSASSSPTSSVIGYLMACSMYSVFWYAVTSLKRSNGFEAKNVRVDFLGSRIFRCAVVDSCWSPHLSEECLVLLETGELYLFDLSCCLKKPFKLKGSVRGKRLPVLCSEDTEVEGRSDHSWLSCEFSWHPRIFIVAHSGAAFLVDARHETFKVSCLLKIEMVSTLEEDGFVSLSRAGSDGFRFCLTSKSLLLLCDIREPCRPLLQWTHNIGNPHYVTVLGLSELRSNVRDEKYRWASEAGSCVVVGSFWDCEFNLFVYGPNNNTNSVSSEISKFCNSMYAWSIPSKLSLSSSSCSCGCCFMRDEAFRESLPDWIDWRQKRELVLGFSILPGKNLVSLVEPDNYDGFLLIRLVSSGKLEAQSFRAAWEFPKLCTSSGELRNCQHNLLYDTNDCDYNFLKKYQHLKLRFLEAYLKHNLDEVLVNNIRQMPHGATYKNVGENRSHGETKELMFSPKIREVAKDIYLPTSIREIALRSIYSGLHMYFASQSEFTDMHKFVRHSDHNLQFPFQKPSSYSRKLLHKVSLNELEDPFLPPPFLLTLRRICSEKRVSKPKVESPDEEIALECSQVLEMASELTGSCKQTDPRLPEGHAVSLSDDLDEFNDCVVNRTQLCFHEPSFRGAEARPEVMPMTCRSANEWSTKFVFRKRQEKAPSINATMNSLELLKADCPLELKFDNRVIEFGQKELKQFELLKKQDMNFQKGFQLYQEYLSKANLQQSM